MQFTKDTFYLALRDRLAELSPAHTIVVDGSERPAVLVAENELDNAAPQLPGAFYLSWGAPQVVGEDAARPLMRIECHIAYSAASAMAGAVDRGRALSALDAELLRLLSPPRTAKLDATRAPASELNSYLFWGTPVLDDVDPPFGRKDGPPTGRKGGAAMRAARLTVFFFPEVQA